MPYKNLLDYIGTLKQKGMLVEINDPVDPELEITAITDYVSKQPGGGKALLFKKNGTNFPVLTNAFGSEKRMCTALGIKNLDDISQIFENFTKILTQQHKSFAQKMRILPQLKKISSWLPVTKNNKGACQDIIDYEPDIFKLPVLKCWPDDGGKFITLPMVITKDPDTGIRNVGMYRMQIFSKNTTGMHWHQHKTGARHYKRYKELNKKMPIAVALGGDPALTYAASAPLPDNIDEYIFAGFLRNKSVRMVKAITQDIEIPADADIIIEGFVDPNEKMAWEGPFGDHTGFYSLADWYPVFHITCITHRKNAVYPATIVGIPPQEDTWITKATERIFINPIRTAILPELTDMDIPAAGTGHNLAIVSIQAGYPGQAMKAMNALWGAGQMMFNKILIITREKTNVHDYKNIAELLAFYVNPADVFHFSVGPADILDHASEEYALGGKLGIDLTNIPEKPLYAFEHEKEAGRIKDAIPHIIKSYPEISGIQTLLLEQNLPVIVLIMDKTIKERTQAIIKQIKGLPVFENIGYIVLTDHTAATFNQFHLLWYVTANIDPLRDIYVQHSTQPRPPKVFIDARPKDTEHDNFTREWPKMIEMNKQKAYKTLRLEAVLFRMQKDN